MGDDGGAFFAGGTLGFVMGLVVASFIFSHITTNIRQECVDRGVAEWAVLEGGDTEFRFLDEPVAKEEK